MPPLPQAPGFPPACPEFLWCPCDSWVVMAGLMTYALIATTLLLALALLIGLAGRRASWRELMPLLLAGLCALLAISSVTATKWRAKAKGPPFIKVGRLVRYRRSDVESWLRHPGRTPGTLGWDRCGVSRRQGSDADA